MATNHAHKDGNPLAVFDGPTYSLEEAAQALKVTLVAARKMLDWNTADQGPGPGSEFPNAHKQRPNAITSPFRIPECDIINYKLRAVMGFTWEELQQSGLIAKPGETEAEVMARVRVYER